MRTIRDSLVALAVLVAAAYSATAAPPEVPSAPVLVKVGGRPAVVTVKVPKDGFGVAPAFSAESVLWFPGETDPNGNKIYLVQPYKPGVYRVVFWTKGETEYSILIIDATGEPGPTPPAPEPPGPPEPPLPPAPQGVRVIMVWETSTGLSYGQNLAAFAKDVETYLDSKTTRGPDNGRGWRRFDPDVEIAKEKDPEIKSLWESVKPNLPAYPCVVVAVGGKAKVLPMPNSVDAALALYKQYIEGK